MRRIRLLTLLYSVLISTATATSTTTAQQTPFPNAQLTTQMAPVAPIPYSLADRDVQAIIEAYKEDPTNPKYAFQHLLLSVTEPQYRVKPAAVSDIMWAEAMSKLEGMDSTERERLWPQLVQDAGFAVVAAAATGNEVVKHFDEIILIEEEFVPVLFHKAANGVTIDPSAESNCVEQGAKVELPFWLAHELHGRGWKYKLMRHVWILDHAVRTSMNLVAS